MELTVLSVIDNWTGAGSDGNWSTAANWDSGVPQAGWDLVFPGGAGQTGNINDLNANTTFHSITIGGAGYDLSGNDIDLSNGITVVLART